MPYILINYRYNLLDNLFEFPYLVKLKDNKGILFGIKETSFRNYIDVSSYFSKVYFANFAVVNYSSNPMLGIISLKKITADMKVLFHGYKYFPGSGHHETYIKAEEISGNPCLPVTYFIVGELK